MRIGDRGNMGLILIAGEPGNQIIPALAPLAGEIVIDKPGKRMFYATGIHERLHAMGITQLVFAGVTTEVCVQTSMREANDRGYECLLIEDATQSYFPEFKAATIAMIVAQGGIVGWVTSLNNLNTAVATSTSVRSSADS
jgi:nicotinamidase-related amidase